MNDLIERLEKATGPDRWLDGQIEVACGGPAFTRHALDDGWHWEFEADDGAFADAGAGLVTVYAVLGNKTSKKQKKYAAPFYTASLDAVLLLVPDEHDWIIGNVNGHVGGTPYACVGSAKEHYGETPVLSFCIAALKARQSVSLTSPDRETT